MQVSRDHPRPVLAHLAVAGACSFLLIAAASSASLVALLSLVEAWLAPGLLGCAAGCWWMQRMGRTGPLTNIVARGSAWGPWPMLTLCVLPLLATWSGHLVLNSVLGGWMPWSDAGNYYSGAMRFLDEGQLHPWACRRPLNALLLACRLAASGGDLQGALLLQSLLGGLALFLATREIWRTFGLAAALFFTGLCYAFFRVCAPTTLSECLGLTLGLLAIPPLLRAVYGQHQRLGWMLGAAFVLSLGQIVRPGTVGLLPALLVWAAFSLGGRRIKRSLLVTVLLVMVFAIPVLANKLALRMYGTDDGIANANFVHTFYGFTRGLSWKEAEVELRGRSGQIREGETWHSAAYRFAFEALREEPSVFAQSLLSNLVHAATTLPQHVMDLLFQTTLRAHPPRILVFFALLSLPLFAPLGIAAWGQLRARSFPHAWFWGLSILGIVATMPIIVRDGGIRVFAATFPLCTALGAALLAHPTPPTTGDHRPGLRSSAGCVGLAMGLLLSALVIPGWLAPRRPPMEDPTPPPFVELTAKDRIVFHVLPEGEDDRRSILSQHRNRLICCNVRYFQHLSQVGHLKLGQGAQQLKAPFSLVMGLDRHSRNPIYGFVEGLLHSSPECAIQLELSQQGPHWRPILSNSIILTEAR
jgi:hypothetical protein